MLKTSLMLLFESKFQRYFLSELHVYFKDTINLLQIFIFTNVIRCSRLPFEKVILSILNLHVSVQ